MIKKKQQFEIAVSFFENVNRLGAINFRQNRYCDFSPYFFLLHYYLLLQNRGFSRKSEYVISKNRQAFFNPCRFLAPTVGLEPTTLRLTAACSTD